MNKETMIAEAHKAKSMGADMILVLPRSFKKPKGFPSGMLLSDCERKGNVYRFNPDKILYFLSKQSEIEA